LTTNKGYVTNLDGSDPIDQLLAMADALMTRFNELRSMEPQLDRIKAKLDTAPDFLQIILGTDLNKAVRQINEEGRTVVDEIKELQELVSKTETGSKECTCETCTSSKEDLGDGKIELVDLIA
jgi:hypothetical protein